MAIELRTLSIQDIDFGERFREEYGDLDTLAASIKKEGIISPLAVCKTGDRYTLLAGGRRFKACTQAGIEEIPVRVFPEGLSPLEMRSIELMENVARKDLSWAEKAKLQAEINDLQIAIHGKKVSTSPNAPGWSQRDTAELLGRSIGGVSDDLKLAEALKVFPQLEKSSTKHDATKLLKKLQEEMVLAEMAKRVQAKAAATPMEVQHQSLISAYILGDFFDRIQKVPDRSIDVVEVDPPYGIDLDALKKDSAGVVMKNYNEVPVEQYVQFLNMLFKECNRVMSENSWLICWFAQHPWFESIFQALMRAGFVGNRVAGIWTKTDFAGQSTQPWSYLASTYETFFYVKKGNPSINVQGRSNNFKYKVVSTQSKIHPTERPIELIQDVLRTFSWEGCRVMVPFLGSGNTLLAAANLGLTAFGFELSEQYKNAYTMRVIEGRPGSYKSYRQEVQEDGV